MIRKNCFIIYTLKEGGLRYSLMFDSKKEAREAFNNFKRSGEIQTGYGSDNEGNSTCKNSKLFFISIVEELSNFDFVLGRKRN